MEDIIRIIAENAVPALVLAAIGVLGYIVQQAYNLASEAWGETRVRRIITAAVMYAEQWCIAYKKTHPDATCDAAQWAAHKLARAVEQATAELWSASVDIPEEILKAKIEAEVFRLFNASAPAG